MRWLSLLLVCLLAAQSVNAIRLAAVPDKIPNKQWVQFTIGFEAATCAGIVRQGPSIVRKGVRDSVKAYFQSKGYSQSIIDSTKGILKTDCADSTDVTPFGNIPYASLRTAVSFKYLTDFTDRNFLATAFRQGPCTGGFDKQVYSVLADAIANAGLSVPLIAALNQASVANPWGPKGFMPLVTPANCASSSPGSPSPAPGSPSPAPSNATSPSPAPGNTTSPAPGNTTSPAPGNTTSPSPAPGNSTSPSPAPGNSTSSSPSPVPASPSPVPDSPSPVPDSPSPVPDSPSPVPESPSPSPVP